MNHNPYSGQNVKRHMIIGMLRVIGSKNTPRRGCTIIHHKTQQQFYYYMNLSLPYSEQNVKRGAWLLEFKGFWWHLRILLTSRGCTIIHTYSRAIITKSCIRVLLTRQKLQTVGKLCKTDLRRSWADGIGRLETACWTFRSQSTFIITNTRKYFKCSYSMASIV